MSCPATFVILTSVMSAVPSAQRQNPYPVAAAPWLAEGSAVNQVSDLLFSNLWLILCHIFNSNLHLYFRPKSNITQKLCEPTKAQ